MNPRDPSSFDDPIDLRGPGAGSGPKQEGEGQGQPEHADLRVEEQLDDDLGEGPDPDNPFSLGPVGPPQAATLPPDGTIRRRPDAGDARPLGLGPIPGPIAGVDGSLDLTAVHPVDDETGPGFLPNRPRRFRAGSVFLRLIATAGIIGIGTAVGAIMVGAGAAGWVVALVVSTLSVTLAALLWRSRRL